MEHNVPTVQPALLFDATADAEVLHKAMKGLGTDEKALIQILCHRTSSQRTEINRTYKSNHGNDLEACLKSESSGNFENVMIALCLPIAEFMAREIHHAVSGIGTNERTLIEILCSSTNHEIKQMKAAYQNLYGRAMEDDIGGDTSGCFKSLLISLSQGERKENEEVDHEKAKETAESLYLAGEARMGTDESTFTSILTTQSLPQLRQIMIDYQAKHGHTLEEAVANEFSYNAKNGLLAILEFAQNRHAYFAHRLHHAIQGLGTNDRDLIRIIVARCDIDLGNIKQEYEKLFEKSLQADISGDTSGDYRTALLALLGQ